MVPEAEEQTRGIIRPWLKFKSTAIVPGVGGMTAAFFWVREVAGEVAAATG
jgi:hypothetical protein